jgi:hypothetical protein
MIMRKKSTQLTMGNMVSYFSRCFLLLVCCLPAGEIFAQNIFSGEPVQWVGQPNGYSTSTLTIRITELQLTEEFQ